MGEPMDRSRRVFGRLSTLAEAFPTIESATISSYEIGQGVYEFRDEPPTFGRGVPFSSGLIECSNRHCRRGGFEVDDGLYRMVGEKLTEKEFVSRCPGDEGSPKGRVRGRRCLNVLHYRLTVKYKPESSPTSERVGV
jgi:hypothetical protein